MLKQKRFYIFTLLVGLLSPTLFSAPASASLKSEELFHFQSINQERAKNSMPDLELSDCLSYGARQHSYWMATTGNIVHSNTSRGDVALNGCGVAVAGSENIVYNFNEYATFNWLLNSTVHRQNMNNSSHTMVGVGSYKHTDGRLYVTQYYVNCSRTTACDQLRQPISGQVSPHDAAGPGPQPLAFVTVRSPQNGTIVNGSTPVSLTVRPNAYPGLLDQDFVVEVSVCKSQQDCKPQTTDSAVFRFTSLTNAVTVELPNLALPYAEKNTITNYTCAIRSIASGAKAPCTSNSFDGSYVLNKVNQNNIHRFYSPVVRHHLFTIDSNEVASIQANFPSSVWKYEGSPFRVSGKADCAAGESVYRFYSSVLQGHLYTVDENEKNHILQNFPSTVWNYEGVAYCANKSQVSGTVPVHRFYSEELRSHLYTIDENEKAHILKTYSSSQWRYEGVAYYAYPN